MSANDLRTLRPGTLGVGRESKGWEAGEINEEDGAVRRNMGMAAALALVLVPAWGGETAAQEKPKGTSKAVEAVEAVAPELPGKVVAAMQEGRFDEAAQAVEALAKDAKTPAANQSYLSLIRGIALRLAGKLDDAREALAAAQKAEPNGRWSAKIRSEMVAVEIAARKFPAAEAIARADAENVLADGRKDRLAEVYRGFAQQLIKPSLPTIPPDPEGAYALLAQALSLAKGEALRSKIRLEMAEASQKANNHARAIGDYQAYLAEFPKGAERMSVRYGLGESQLAANQPLPARLTWTDLARDLEKIDTQESADIRSKALFGIAKTHGFPNPPDDAQLGLGVAVLKRMIAANPGHRLAVLASYQIAQSYLARGKTEESLAAFESFLKGTGFRARPRRRGATWRKR